MIHPNDTLALGGAEPNLPDALGVPAPSSPVIDGHNALFHARNLTTGDVAKALDGHPEVRIVQLYADTLTVSDQPPPRLRGLTGWQVVAREVRVASDTPLVMEEHSQLLLHTGRIANPDHTPAPNTLHVRVPGPDGKEQEHRPGLAGDHGLKLQVSDHTLKATAPTAGPVPSNSRPVELGKSLTLLFQIATQLWATDPEQAVAMLRWVTRLAAQSTDLRHVFAQASSLVALHDSDRLHGWYVPHLNRDAYGGLLTTYKDSVKEYETNYTTLRNSTASLDTRARAAQALLAHTKDTSGFHTLLRQQAQDNADAAARTLEQARRNLRTQQDQVTAQEVQFRAEMENYHDEQVEKAVVDAGLAVLSLGVGAASGATGAFTATAQIEKLVKTVETVKNIISEAQRIRQVVADLQSSLATLDRLRELQSTMHAGATDLSTAPAQRISDLLRATAGGGTVNVSARWEEFQAIARTVFGHLVQKTGVGAKYQGSLETLAVYGRAFASAQAGHIQAAQQLIRATIQEQLTARSADTTRGYIAELKASGTLNDLAAQSFYQAYLDQKRWLFVALENYGRAYRYWALAEPRVRPTMSADAAHIAQQISEISREYEQALGRFSPPPQNMVQSFTVTDGLQALREQGELMVPLTLGHPAFRGLERVRLTTIRVYLIGARQTEGESVRIGIHGSGLYQDRFAGREFRFCAAPAERAFEYRPGQKRPVIDGTVEASFGRVLMQPTPFTEWRFTVRRDHNPGLDLTDLKEVRVEMLGSAISPGT
ncbi:hypothetical protein [Nocardiopsis sp. YSL2]|uniref:hypothetical protein n=1 Tax=Nocardiopsis sp. YSL2 TaxID=2939492 RepID=UPI0026F40C9C|nr:hypothetical protein [Nocardiopsis sp. YSL2]